MANASAGGVTTLVMSMTPRAIASRPQVCGSACRTRRGICLPSKAPPHPPRINAALLVRGPSMEAPDEWAKDKGFFQKIIIFLKGAVLYMACRLRLLADA